MIPYARLGDTATHGGAIVTASPFVFSEDFLHPLARLTDEFLCDIHGAQTIVTASKFVFEDAGGAWLPYARSGDLISCTAIIIEPCSPVVFEQG
jgi:uncharacterized Zn-binding protein involved in type VI secretion